MNFSPQSPQIFTKIALEHSVHKGFNHYLVANVEGFFGYLYIFLYFVYFEYSSTYMEKYYKTIYISYND